MELIDGVSLRDILARQGKTTPEAALVVLQGSLLGLAAAHRRGVVHRDYKPENVLIDGAGASKLTDFGIAARAGDSPIPAGTLVYAPPEQFGGSPATPASDVYAATATFYECLAGRPPFTGDTAARLLYQHMSEPVPLEPVPEPLRPLVAAGQGSTVHQVRLHRHIRPRRISMIKAAIAAGVAVVAAGTALAVVSHRPARPAASTPALTGTWTGSYTCSQGLTGLRLVVLASRDGTLTGTFSFYALPANPRVPSGEYTVTGTYAATRTDIKPGHWIKQPSGYVLVGLTAGPPADNGTLLRGKVSTPGCTTFSITKS